jgi:hypothetical protein
MLFNCGNGLRKWKANYGSTVILIRKVCVLFRSVFLARAFSQEGMDFGETTAG